MATLINRECWYFDGGTYLHGRVASHDIETGMAGILLDSGKIKTVLAHAIILTRIKAISVCEDNADYWNRMKDMLEQEQEDNGQFGVGA